MGPTGKRKVLNWADSIQLVTAGTNNNSINFHDTTTGEELFSLSEHTATVIRVVLSPDGSRLYSTGWDLVKTPLLTNVLVFLRVHWMLIVFEFSLSQPIDSKLAELPYGSGKSIQQKSQ